MRARLADSLGYVIDRLEPHVPIDRAASATLLERIGAGPVSPLVFGAYYEIVLAIERHSLEDACSLLGSLTRIPVWSGIVEIVCLPDEDAFPGAGAYRRLFAMDPDTPLSFRPPRPAQARAAHRHLSGALELLRRGAPALAGEIGSLVRQVVLARGAQDAGARDFDGASAFMLWGAVLLNASRPRSSLEMVTALAHESAHNLLFGLCADGPLVRGDDAARYASPLRADRRPMDGIVHATFVTARMCYAMEQLLRAGVLGSCDGARAQAAVAKHRARFAAGMETVDRHAELTPLGEAVMEGARQYMNGVHCP